MSTVRLGCLDHFYSAPYWTFIEIAQKENYLMLSPSDLTTAYTLCSDIPSKAGNFCLAGPYNDVGY